MIPYLLAVAGGYLVGNALKDNSSFAEGGQIMYYRDEDKIKDASGRELKIGDSVIVSGRVNNVAIVKDIDEKESKMGGFGVKVVYKDGSEDRVSVGDLKYT
jgi:uncharacterized Zn ribbon protein